MMKDMNTFLSNTKKNLESQVLSETRCRKDETKISFVCKFLLLVIIFNSMYNLLGILLAKRDYYMESSKLYIVYEKSFLTLIEIIYFLFKFILVKAMCVHDCEYLYFILTYIVIDILFEILKYVLISIFLPQYLKPPSEETVTEEQNKTEAE